VTVDGDKQDGHVQLDTDGDGYGNACDCDFDQDRRCTVRDLIGSMLEANVVVPLENDELARELDLRPRAGSSWPARRGRGRRR
jgi:hypothetical protein